MNGNRDCSVEDEDRAFAAIVEAFAASVEDIAVWDSAEDEMERRIRNYVNQK